MLEKPDYEALIKRFFRKKYAAQYAREAADETIAEFEELLKLEADTDDPV